MLVFLSLCMLVGCYVAGSIPLAVTLSEVGIPTHTLTATGTGTEHPNTRGRCKHRNTGASTGIDRNTGESRQNAPEYTVCVNVYDVCVCSVWLYFVFNVSRTN